MIGSLFSAEESALIIVSVEMESHSTEPRVSEEAPAIPSCLSKLYSSFVPSSMA